MTVQESFTQYGLFKQDISDISQSLFLQWANILNRAVYRLIINIDPERFITEVSYSTFNSPNPSTQALPAGFKTIQQWNTGFFLLDANGNLTTQKLVLTNPSNQIYGYYLNGANVVFTAPQTQNYKLRYIPELSALTFPSGSYVIPDEYMDYVLRALDVLYSQWDEDYVGEGVADQRFVRVLDELGQDISRVPLSFNMPDTSSSYVDIGNCGSYYDNFWL